MNQKHVIIGIIVFLIIITIIYAIVLYILYRDKKLLFAPYTPKTPPADTYSFPLFGTQTPLTSAQIQIIQNNYDLLANGSG